MTSRPVTGTLDTEKVRQFPDVPPEEMTAFRHVNYPAYPASLSLHFGNQETTVITSELAAGLRETESYEGVLFPDLLVAFGVDPKADTARNGYLIPEQGKPPDFVLEVASKTTARNDETDKRDAYAAMGVGEYWRSDPTGGQQYQAPLAASARQAADARADAADARADAEALARLAAEAEVRRLGEELRGRQTR